MTPFTTSGPVALSIRFPAGRLIVTADAGSVTTASIDVRPGNPDSSADAELAATTVVEQHGDAVTVIAPTIRGWLGRTPRLEIRAVVPPHSTVDASVKSADVHVLGELGRLSVVSASGNVDAEHVDELATRTASGDVGCSFVKGDASVVTASGDIRLDTVEGAANASTASGDITISAVGAGGRVRTASGDVRLGHLDGSVVVRTASGDILVERACRGTIEIDSASGDAAVGVADGVAAWLDVETLSGKVTSSLDPAAAPDADAETVSIRARTHSGDINIRRAPNAAAEHERGTR